MAKLKTLPDASAERLQAILGNQIRKPLRGNIVINSDGSNPATDDGAGQYVVYVKLLNQPEIVLCIYNPYKIKTAELTDGLPVFLKRNDEGEYELLGADTTSVLTLGSSMPDPVNLADFFHDHTEANLPLGTNSVTTNSITDSAVTTVKIADANVTNAKLAGTITVALGGTGRATLTANNLLAGNGTGTVNLIAPSTSGNILQSNGTSWASVAPSFNASVITAGTLGVARGGTGLGTLTLNNVILGNGTGTPLFVAPSTSGNLLTSNGTTWQSTAPSFNASVISSGTLDNARVNWASPGTIGSTTPNTGAFTTMTATKEWSPAATTNLIATFSSYGDVSRFVIRRANGTIASPTQVLSGEIVGSIGFRGTDNTGAFSTVNSSGIFSFANENFTTTAQGTYLSFYTQANGTSAGASPRLNIENDGSITIVGNTSGVIATNGAIAHNTTSKHHESYTAGAVGVLCRRLFGLTATSTVANTITETAFTLTGNGITTLPADFLTVAKAVRVKARGFFSSTGTPTLRLRLFFAGASAWTSLLISVGAVTSYEFDVDVTIDCYTTGVSGTGFIEGHADFGSIARTTYANTSATTINTTTTNAIELKATFSVADPANTITLTNFRIFEE